MPRRSEQSLVQRAAQALRKRALQPDGLLQRFSDRIAFPQLYKHYSENFLTHGEQFLRGHDELPLFAPDVWHAPIKWRPIPGPSTVSLSRASLSTTEAGTAMLRGHYGGSRGDVALLAGASDATEKAPVGAGACGVASMGHWPLDLTQHHWLELKLRTGTRRFELVLQSDGQWEGSERLWRAGLPAERSATDDSGQRGGGSGGGGGGGVGRGAYGVLGVPSDATDSEIREAYRSLVRTLHPDIVGGDEEQFKRVSRAYSLLGDAQKRKRYDEVGATDGDVDDDDELDDLGPWRSLKVPFTAFRDRTFFRRAEVISVVYVLVDGETPGPFALEIGEVKAGRCEKGHLDGAGQMGHVSCEQGHCECGYYNGLRVEAFEGPLPLSTNGRIREGALEWGFAEHHLRDGEFDE